MLHRFCLYLKDGSYIDFLSKHQLEDYLFSLSPQINYYVEIVY